MKKRMILIMLMFVISIAGCGMGNTSADKTPKKLSDDLEDFTFMLEGDVFSLPCSLQVFEDYGWEITECDSKTEVEGNTSTRVEFKKGDFEFSNTVMNFSDESVPLNECILDSIMLLVRNKDYSFEIAGGIKKGDKIEDDKEKLESLGFEIDGLHAKLVYEPIRKEYRLSIGNGEITSFIITNLYKK